MHKSFSQAFGVNNKANTNKQPLVQVTQAPTQTCVSCQRPASVLPASVLSCQRPASVLPAIRYGKPCGAARCGKCTLRSNVKSYRTSCNLHSFRGTSTCPSTSYYYFSNGTTSHTLAAAFTNYSERSFERQRSPEALQTCPGTRGCGHGPTAPLSGSYGWNGTQRSIAQ
jgi:hypothetical protein